MLKSTHKSASAASPLAPGWTEHKAPTGHFYYYNSATKESTYIRPTAAAPQPVAQVINGGYGPLSTTGLQANFLPPQFHNSGFPGQIGLNSGFPHRSFPPGPANRGARGGHGGFNRGQQDRRPPPEDRPKSKHVIPNCSPWLLIKTKLGRRFVYNPDENVSHWKFPPNVMTAMIEYDRIEREECQRKEQGEPEVTATEVDRMANELGPDQTAEAMPHNPSARPVEPDDDSDEYEEVEVTDDEDAEDAPDGPSKRQKLDEPASGTAPNAQDQRVEFDEDDIAYQLAAMGQDYGLDPGEYGAGDEDAAWEEGAEGLALTEADSLALFHDMLDDHGVSPYTPWDTLVSAAGGIVDDERYVALTTRKARKEAWEAWSRERIARLKERREREERKDPKMPYFAFLEKNATPKLYWPEFRRKFRGEREMKDSRIADKDREKWYREYIARLKLPESTLKASLTSLLHSLPAATLHRNTLPSALPAALLTSVVYISLRPSVRDPLVEAYIQTSAPPEPDAAADPEMQAEREKRRVERERRERALEERERAVRREKRRVEGEVLAGRQMLREGEREVLEARRVGKGGLMGFYEGEAEEEEEEEAGTGG